MAEDSAVKNNRCEGCAKWRRPACSFNGDQALLRKTDAACFDFEKGKDEIRIVQKPTVVTSDFLAEMVWNRQDNPRYILKNFNDGSIDYKDELDLGETDLKGNPIIYRPVDNPALRKGLVIVPSEPKETTFAEAFEKADKFLLTCYDPLDKVAYAKLLVRVVAGSWFLDRFVSDHKFDVSGVGKFAPIIPIRGPSQSGKNRLAFVLRLLSYRPYFEMSTFRIPSLYRPLDLWNGTLVLDEGDFRNTGENSELTHFLNCRATGTPISRQNPKNPKLTDVFTNLGLTIITQRRGFDDNATESRSLPYYSEKTERKLPTVETDDMLKTGLELQDYFLFLRLKFFQDFTIDKTAWFEEVQDPRLMASLLPLLTLSKTIPSIKEMLAKTVIDIEKMKVAEKARSEDGSLINHLWEKGLFARYSELPNNEVFFFQAFTDEEEKQVVPLTVKVLADEFKSKTYDIRKILTSLNMCDRLLPRVAKIGNKAYRPIWFSPAKLEKRLREFVLDYEPYQLYDKLGLPRPDLVTQVTHVTAKLCSGFESKDKRLSDYPENIQQEENPSHSTDVTSVTSVTETDEATELIKHELSSGQGRHREKLTKNLLDTGLTEQQANLKFAQLVQDGIITIDDVGTVFLRTRECVS